jgi:hypothetical protein
MTSPSLLSAPPSPNVLRLGERRGMIRQGYKLGSPQYFSGKFGKR